MTLRISGDVFVRSISELMVRHCDSDRRVAGMMRYWRVDAVIDYVKGEFRSSETKGACRFARLVSNISRVVNRQANDSFVHATEP